MKLQAVFVAALIGFAGCGGGDDQLDREQLVPQGMRRTTVTARDARTETGARTETDTKTQTTPPAREPAAPASQTEPVATTATVAAAPVTDVAVAEPPAETVTPVANGGAFVVQAGAFKQPTTAEGVVAKLRGLGVAARIEAAQVGGNTFHRVVVPGLADRAAADAMVARLKQELGIDAVVRTP